MLPCSFRVTTTFSLRATTRNWASIRACVPFFLNVLNVHMAFSTSVVGMPFSPSNLNIDFARSKEGVFLGYYG